MSVQASHSITSGVTLNLTVIRVGERYLPTGGQRVQLLENLMHESCVKWMFISLLILTLPEKHLNRIILLMKILRL